MPLLATPELAQCDLQKDAALSFRGYCQWPDRKVDAKLTRHDTFRTGEMTPRNPEDPDLFDVTDRAQRLAKTPYCWFPIASLSIGNGRLTLSFSIASEVPPSSDDSRILQLALQMLQDESRWNRHGCPQREIELPGSGHRTCFRDMTRHRISRFPTGESNQGEVCFIDLASKPRIEWGGGDR